jgi:ribosome maturation factor RimP
LNKERYERKKTMKEWIGKKCKVFVRNLMADKPVIYTGTITSADEHFVTMKARNAEMVSINITDIIQIKEEEESASFYRG